MLKYQVVDGPNTGDFPHRPPEHRKRQRDGKAYRVVAVEECATPSALPGCSRTATSFTARSFRSRSLSKVRVNKGSRQDAGVEQDREAHEERRRPLRHRATQSSRRLVMADLLSWPKQARSRKSTVPMRPPNKPRTHLLSAGRGTLVRARFGTCTTGTLASNHLVASCACSRWATPSRTRSPGLRRALSPQKEVRFTQGRRWFLAISTASFRGWRIEPAPFVEEVGQQPSGSRSCRSTATIENFLRRTSGR